LLIEDTVNFTKIFTTWEKEEIEKLIAEHSKAPHERKLQKELARDITIRVHSAKDFEMAFNASNILFGNSVTKDLESLDEVTLLSLFEGVPQASISKSELAECTSVVDLLSETTKGTVFASKGEARRMIQAGGVSINKTKLTDPSLKPAFNLLQNKYLLAQKGKKNYYLITIE